MKKILSVKKTIRYLFEEGPIVFLVVAVFFLRNILANPFILGQKFDWYLPLFNFKGLFSQAFYSWNAENTGSFVGYYSAWLADLFFGLGGLCGISPKLFIPLFLALILALAGWGMFKLLRFVHTPWPIAQLAGIFYLLSPAVFIRIVIGFTLWLIAYALAPIIVWLFLKSIHERRWLIFCLWAGILLGLSAVQIQFPLMISLLLLISTISRGHGIKFINRFQRFFIIIALAALVQLPWLLATMARGFSQNAESLASGSAVLKAITGLPHSFLRTIFLNDHHITAGLFDQLNHQPLNYWVNLIFLAAIALGVIIFWKKILFRWKILISFVAGFLISVAAHPHFAWLFEKLFNLTKFVNLFREVYHGQFLISFSYALAFGCLAGFLWHQKKSQLFRSSLFLVGACFIAIFCQVSLKGDFTEFGAAFKPERYQAVYDKFQRQPKERRVWYPLGLGFIQSDKGVGASNGDVLARSLGLSFIDEGSSNLNQPNNVTNVRNTMIHQFEQGHKIDPFLKKFAAPIILDRKDMVSLNLGVLEESQINSQIKSYWRLRPIKNGLNLSSWSETEIIPTAALYQSKEIYQKIYPSKSVFLSAGSFQDLKSTADIIFLHQLGAGQPLLKNIPLLKEADDFEIKTSATDQRLVVNPESRADKNFKATQGWSQGRFSWWYNSDFASSVWPFIFTRVADDLRFKIKFNHIGFHDVYFRIWYSPLGGLLSFGVGDKSMQINTKSAKAEWRWTEIKDVVLEPKNHYLDLKALTGDQAVSSVVLIPHDQKDEINQKVVAIKKQTKLVNYDRKAEVDWQAVSPTNYRVKIKNTKPFLLVFAEGYDQHWVLKIDGKKYQPIITNGWACGFWIDRPIDSTGKIVYSLQIWYLLGLIIASLTILGTVGYSMYCKIKARRDG